MLLVGIFYHKEIIFAPSPINNLRSKSHCFICNSVEIYGKYPVKVSNKTLVLEDLYTFASSISQKFRI